MEDNFSNNKSYRLLDMNERLNKGEILDKKELALKYSVSEKTIQRDIVEIRSYLANTMYEYNTEIKYDKTKGGYYLIKSKYESLTNTEVLAICKIILESRAFCKQELTPIIDKMVMWCSPKDRAKVKELITSEKFHYTPLKHNKKLLNTLWELTNIIVDSELTSISYKRADNKIKEHTVKPVSIMFSEYYFYLIAYISDREYKYPAIFRIDRIQKFEKIGEKFKIPYIDKFSEGEFRKRVQFMYSGELQTVIFEYSGVLEAVLDRLPTARILNEHNGVYKISAETYGDGIKMWIRSQGDNARILNE